MKKILWLFILLVCLWCSPANATTRNATDCTEAAINSAIGLASTGDTITVKGGTACSATWTGAVDIATKQLKLIGGGKTVTLITNGSVTVGANSRLSGFGFTTTLVNVDFDGWRIDNNSFTRDGNSVSIAVRGTRATAHPTGLIDQNVFVGAYIIVVGNLSPADRGNASGLWALGPDFGGATNVVFIENNTFSNVYYGMDAGHGGRFVYRYNTNITAPTGPHGIQSLDYRSNPRMEIYNNTYTTPNGFESAIKLRGGTALVFNNSVTGSYTNIIIIDNQTSTRYGDYSLVGCSAIGMACDGTNPRDGNRTARQGYPCRDQIGRGQDVPQWGFTNIKSISKHNPAVVTYTYLYGSTLSNGDTITISEVAGMTEVNGRTFTIANKNDNYGVWTFELKGEDSSGYRATGSGGIAYKAYNQALSPLYVWNNTKDGVDASAPVVKHENPYPGCTPSNPTRYNLHLIADRDFYYSTAIQTAKGNPFNGTSGVGYGLLAYRPDTCNSLPVATGVPNEPGGGVAYWATDTNTLYRCSVMDTWTVHYRPFTYPHPLGRPEPPKDLRIR